jgi:hypothetical protein
MQRAFTRATAPEKPVEPGGSLDGSQSRTSVVSVHGVRMAHLEDRLDSHDDADAVLAIVAKHRATTR